MKSSTQIYMAVFWILFWTAQILCNFDGYMRTESGRMFLALFFLALVLGLIFVLYVALKPKWPRIMYKVDSTGRCPDCFNKLDDSKDFCPFCGRDLTLSTGPRVCWNCGYEEEDKNVTSCPKCGREFKK